MHQEIQAAGIAPVLHRLDNETSNDLIQAITDKQLTYQLAYSGDHHLDHAEISIQSFKNQFISDLHGTDTKFPVSQCDTLIPQTVMTLNV